jgi:hypothetical protein
MDQVSLMDQVSRMETLMGQVLGPLPQPVCHFQQQIFQPELTSLRQLLGHSPESLSLLQRSHSSIPKLLPHHS